MKKAYFATLLALSSPTFAGGYAGIGFGQSRVDMETDEFTLSKDDTDTSYRIFGGVDLSDNLAVEIGYVDFGKFGATAAGAFTDGTYDYYAYGTDDINGSALYAAVLGKLPVGPSTDLFAKLGLASWQAESNVDVTYDAYIAGTGNYAGSFSASERVSDSGTDPMFGVGVSFALSDTLAIRGEYEVFKDVGKESTTGKSDVTILSASAVIRF